MGEAARAHPGFATGALDDATPGRRGLSVDTGNCLRFAVSGSTSRVRVLAGRRKRQGSVGYCLGAVPDGFDLIAIHDPVQPLVRAPLIEEVIRQAAVRRAVILGMPAEDTVKQVSQEVARSPPGWP